MKSRSIQKADVYEDDLSLERDEPRHASAPGKLIILYPFKPIVFQIFSLEEK